MRCPQCDRYDCNGLRHAFDAADNSAGEAEWTAMQRVIEAARKKRRNEVVGECECGDACQSCVEHGAVLDDAFARLDEVAKLAKGMVMCSHGINHSGERHGCDGCCSRHRATL